MGIYSEIVYDIAEEFVFRARMKKSDRARLEEIQKEYGGCLSLEEKAMIDDRLKRGDSFIDDLLPENPTEEDLKHLSAKLLEYWWM